MVKRIAFFIYGCVAYLVFLATFLYAIAFVGGFAVPTRLDGAPQTPLAPALASDAALLAIFAVQHSVMARRWVKADNGKDVFVANGGTNTSTPVQVLFVERCLNLLHPGGFFGVGRFRPFLVRNWKISS